MTESGAMPSAISSTSLKSTLDTSRNSTQTTTTTTSDLSRESLDSNAFASPVRNDALGVNTVSMNDAQHAHFTEYDTKLGQRRRLSAMRQHETHHEASSFEDDGTRGFPTLQLPSDRITPYIVTTTTTSSDTTDSHPSSTGSLHPDAHRNPTIHTQITNAEGVPKTFLSPLRTMTPKSRAKSVFLQYTEGKTPRDLQRETLRMAFTPNQNPTEASPNFLNVSSALTGEIIPRDLTFDSIRADYSKRIVVKRPKVRKNFRINQVGVPIEYKKHTIYPLMKSMQLGVRTLIDRIYERPRRELSSDDFKAKVKVNFPSPGSDTTPTHNFTTFEFKDFHPMAFRHIRDVFGVDHGEYISSLCGAESLSMLGTPGKSNALFFYSYNTRYILKTVTKREAKMLTKILPHYLEHIRNNPDTLLCRFYGLHRIKTVGKKGTVRFVVMNNVFHTHLKIHEKYDLKGSTQGRYAKDKNHPGTILKDLDMNTHIKIGNDKTKKILLQIAKDCRFLANHGIMDYSMLIGMHYESKANPEESFLDWNTDNETNEKRNSLNSGAASPINLRSSLSWFDTKEPRRSIFQMDGGGCRSIEDESGGAIVYFFGIIDILQEYNPRKRAERFFKSLRYSSSKISVAMPHYYSLRFQEFMRKVFVADEDNSQEESYIDYDPRFFPPSRSNTDMELVRPINKEELWPETHGRKPEFIVPNTSRSEISPFALG